MRHVRSRLRLKQKPAHAKMMERNLATSVLLYESIRTTRKRAKVIQPLVDKLISYAKSHPPHVAVRYINTVVTDKNAGRKIMEVYRDRFKNRSSGLSRIVPLGSRKGDGAELVELSLLDSEQKS
jgi:large subunit ribosomal protein L17